MHVCKNTLTCVFIYIYTTKSIGQQAFWECLCSEQGCRYQSQRKTALLGHACVQGLKRQGFLLLSVFPKEMERSNSLCYGANDYVCASYRCACWSTVIQVLQLEGPVMSLKFRPSGIIWRTPCTRCLHPLELPSLPLWHLAPLVKPVVQVLLKSVKVLLDENPNLEKSGPIAIEAECLWEQSPFKFYLILNL